MIFPGERAQGEIMPAVCLPCPSKHAVPVGGRTRPHDLPKRAGEVTRGFKPVSRGNRRDRFLTGPQRFCRPSDPCLQNKIGRRHLQSLAKDAVKGSRGHVRILGEVSHRQRLPKMLFHPGHRAFQTMLRVRRDFGLLSKPSAQKTYDQSQVSLSQQIPLVSPKLDLFLQADNPLVNLKDLFRAQLQMAAR